MVSCKQATPTRPADDPSFTSEHEVLIFLYLNGPGEVLSGFEFTSDERLVDHDLATTSVNPLRCRASTCFRITYESVHTLWGSWLRRSLVQIRLEADSIQSWLDFRIRHK